MTGVNEKTVFAVPAIAVARTPGGVPGGPKSVSFVSIPPLTVKVIPVPAQIELEEGEIVGFKIRRLMVMVAVPRQPALSAVKV